MHRSASGEAKSQPLLHARMDEFARASVDHDAVGRPMRSNVVARDEKGAGLGVRVKVRSLLGARKDRLGCATNCIRNRAQ